MSKKRNAGDKRSRIDPELVEEIKREMDHPSDTTVPDLPEFSVKDREGGAWIVRRRGKKKRGK